MEDSCSSSRGILSSTENLDIERVRPKRPAKDEDLSGYLWYKPQIALEERRHVTEQRRDELLQTLYQEGLDTDEVEGLVKEWIVLVIERDKLFREYLDKENVQGNSLTSDKSSYLRELRRVLRAHPPFAENSEEVNIREALLNLESHVTTYCTRHDITSPGNCPPRSKGALSDGETDRENFVTDNEDTPKPAQQVALDHQTGQSHVSRVSQPPAQHSTEEPDCPADQRPATPHPPLPVKPQNLKEKLAKASPKRLSPAKSSHETSRNAQPRPLGMVVIEDNSLPAKPGVTEMQPGVTFEPAQASVEMSANDATPPCLQVTSPPLPPPLPPHPTNTPRTAMGTVQFVGSQHHTPSNGNGEPLSNELVDEPQDPSLELPTSEERSLLMNEISSVGQTILRQTNRSRSPGGTPLRASKNRLTLTGNTDMLQRALISKFRSFHSTPIKRTNDKTDSMDVSNAWSDVNGSMVYEDPDITATSNSLAGVSDSSGLRQDPNLSSAV